jgi:hypothetical protein
VPTERNVSHISPLAGQLPSKAQWPVPGLVDSRLSYTRLPLELHRALVSDRRVPASGIVEALV